MGSLDHLDDLIVSRVQLKEILGVLDGNDLVLDSDHEKRGYLKPCHSVLHRIEVVYAEICLLFDRPRDDLQSCVEYDLRNLRILLRHVFHQSLQALERTIEHSSPDFPLILGQVQQSSDRPHRSPPKRNTPNLRVILEILHYFPQVLLLVVAKRDVLSLGVAAATEVEGAESHLIDQQSTKVLRPQQEKRLPLESVAAVSVQVNHARVLFEVDGQPKRAGEVVTALVAELEVLAMEFLALDGENGRAEGLLSVGSSCWPYDVSPQLVVLFLQLADKVHSRGKLSRRQYYGMIKKLFVNCIRMGGNNFCKCLKG